VCNERLLRCRGNLLRDRIPAHESLSRITQSARRLTRRSQQIELENELVNLRTGDGRSFPRQLMNEVRREGKLLGTVVRMLKEVEAGIAGMIRAERKRRHPAQRGQNHPIARRLAEISRSRAAKPPAYSRQRYSIEGSRIAGKSRATSA
jgi:hypothetical protein